MKLKKLFMVLSISLVTIFVVTGCGSNASSLEKSDVEQTQLTDEKTVKKDQDLTNQEQLPSEEKQQTANPKQAQNNNPIE